MLTCNGGTSGMSCIPVTLTADIAECVDLSSSDPSYCEGLTGAGTLAVDLMDMTSGAEQRGYLKFTIPSAPPFQKLVSASLQLTGSNDPATASQFSGEVWPVAAFDLATLNQIPAPVGAAPLATDVGPVTQGQVVTWPIPVRRIPAPGALYLGVLPVDPNGTVYDNTRGPFPPRLVLEYAP